jgi:predicted nucleic acid-binding protein
LIQFVLDASVAVKWALPPESEPLVPESLDLLQQYRKTEIDFLVPDIFWAEITNVSWKGYRQGRWSQSTAEQIVSDMKINNFPTVPCKSLMTDALKIALTYDRSVYDSLYVALAIQVKTEMITCDERLANALAAYLPVKWLGAMSV